jgi:protein-tyrosine phosphatase
VSAFHVLCVCTGNVFRSRIMAAELRRGLVDADAADEFEVSTAGTGAIMGAALSEHDLVELRRVGVDASPPAWVRALTGDAIDRADLVLVAERAHRSRVLDIAPAALHRTFLFGEFARLADSVRPTLTDTSARALPLTAASRPHRARLAVAVVAAHRARFAPETTDEVPDPAAGPPDRLDEVAERLRAAAVSTLDVLMAVDRVGGDAA